MSSVSILKSTKKKGEIDIIPSVIGMDFLTSNNLSLHYNPKKKEAYLFKED